MRDPSAMSVTASTKAKRPATSQGLCRRRCTRTDSRGPHIAPSPSTDQALGLRLETRASTSGPDTATHVTATASRNRRDVRAMDPTTAATVRVTFTSRIARAVPPTLSWTNQLMKVR